MNKTYTLALSLALGCSRSAPPSATVTPAAPVATAPAAAPEAPANNGLRATELAVESRARDTILAVGDPAPTFSATTHDGHAVASTGGPRERVLVVYFYPRDETPGCTREACAFRDAFSAYGEAGADLVGVSTDSLEAHRAFAQHHTLPFGLIADPRGWLAAAFGVQNNGGFLQRATFVIGRDGRVAQVFPQVRVDGHSDEVLAAVRAAAAR
ncbi:MAG: peroxiredoxin [Polyangiales bacterium]